MRLAQCGMLQMCYWVRLQSVLCSINFLLDIVFGNLTPVLENLLNRQKWYTCDCILHSAVKHVIAWQARWLLQCYERYYIPYCIQFFWKLCMVLVHKVGSKYIHLPSIALTILLLTGYRALAPSWRRWQLRFRTTMESFIILSKSTNYTYDVVLYVMLWWTFRHHSALMIEAQQRLVMYYIDSLMRKYVCNHQENVSLLWWYFRRIVFKNEKERQKGGEQIKKDAKHISSFFARLSHATNPKVIVAILFYLVYIMVYWNI